MSNIVKCAICNMDTQEVFTGRLMGKYDVAYFTCNSCFHLQTEKPYWLEEAYENPINSTDTGLLGRNIYLSKIVSLLCFILDKRGRYLDFAGGYGVFTRLMRDVGFDFYWNDGYAKNLFAQGFDYQQEYEQEGHFTLLTSFETFEHFEYPKNELKKMLKLSENILISTNLFRSKEIPSFSDWWYYGKEHGQHISFFTLESLKALAKDFDLNLYSNHVDLHYLTKSKSNKFKFKFLFFVFGNQAWKRLFRELIFIYIKFKMPSKTFADMKMVQEKSAS